MFVPEDSKTIAFDTKTGAVRWEKPLIATNDLGDGSHPSPAVAGGRLFLVGKENVFCVGKQ